MISSLFRQDHGDNWTEYVSWGGSCFQEEDFSASSWRTTTLGAHQLSSSECWCISWPSTWSFSTSQMMPQWFLKPARSTILIYLQGAVTTGSALTLCIWWLLCYEGMCSGFFQCVHCHAVQFPAWTWGQLFQHSAVQHSGLCLYWTKYCSLCYLQVCSGKALINVDFWQEIMKELFITRMTNDSNNI